MYRYIRKYKGENDKEFESRVNTALNSHPSENSTVAYTNFSDNFVTVLYKEIEKARTPATIAGFSKQ